MVLFTSEDNNETDNIVQERKGWNTKPGENQKNLWTLTQSD